MEPKAVFFQDMQNYIANAAANIMGKRRTQSDGLNTGSDSDEYIGWYRRLVISFIKRTPEVFRGQTGVAPNKLP